jgi:hypothetical protein
MAQQRPFYTSHLNTDLNSRRSSVGKGTNEATISWLDSHPVVRKDSIDESTILKLHQRLSQLAAASQELLPYLDSSTSIMSSPIRVSPTHASPSSLHPTSPTASLLDPSLLEFHVSSVLNHLRDTITFMYSIAPRSPRANYLLQTALRNWVQTWKSICNEWETFLDKQDMNIWHGLCELTGERKREMKKGWERINTTIRSQVSSFIKYGEILVSV